MSNVYIGKGKLDSKGLDASRDFKEGELVNEWNLKELTQDDFDALPQSEQKFVHSFWGKMYLFPEPCRYTNHSAHPTVQSDFKKMCDYATRPIKKGDAITVNATEEVKYELKTFLEAYEKAANSSDFTKVEPLISNDATFIFTDGTFKGKLAIKKAFEDTWRKIQNETYSISDIKWVKTGYRNAVCEYTFTSDGVVNGKRSVYKGIGTNTFKRINGNWRIIKEHLQKLD
jgi:ketosteroid isomerase-like protein